jgi:uncharacterized NAD(P)/FAD-binding protein YdhS
MTNRIGIIGGGFSGTILVRHLVNQTNKKLDIILFNYTNKLSGGVAYNPKSKRLLLNVIASKMSAFPDQPNHFVEWCLKNGLAKENESSILASSFLPRAVYGQYLKDIWNETIEISRKNGHELNVFEEEEVQNVQKTNGAYNLKSKNYSLNVDFVVLATGNELPGNPEILNPSFFHSEYYHQNPWKINLSNFKNDQPILIIGNGLTMVDTVIELRENGFNQKIVSVSPNGFNILPHRNFTFEYKGLLTQISEKHSLLEIVTIFNQELKRLNEFGISAEPLIDSLRPNTQKIWKRLSLSEKRLFLKRLRHLWGVARHRIPFVSYDFIQKQQIENRLEILAGKIIDISVQNGIVHAEVFDKKRNTKIKHTFSNVINCTGPETNISRLGDCLLLNMLNEELIVQDELNLGIQVNEQFQVIDKEGRTSSAIFAMGNLIKGVLWESTAINELRSQAKYISEKLVNR